MKGRASPLRTVPSRNIGGFLFVLAAMWYAGASQSNGAAFILFFLLLSVVLISFPQTFANLRGLKVAPSSVKPAFAGQEIALPLEIMNTARHTRHTISASLPGMGGDSQTVDEIPPRKAVWLTIRFPAVKRGAYEIPAALLASGYPIGAFKATCSLPLKQAYLVYPKPAGDPNFPQSKTASVRRPEGVQLEGDDFTGVRSYLPGESQRHVDWKAVARGQPMMTKQFASEKGGTLDFDFSTMAMRGTEARLSQLALWVIEAERAHRRYSLRLPAQVIPASLGEPHYHRCLQALALFQ